MKCLVYKCKNQDLHERGIFINIMDENDNTAPFWICMPCWDTITGKNDFPQYTQIYKNIKEHMFRPGLDVEKYYND